MSRYDPVFNVTYFNLVQTLTALECIFVTWDNGKIYGYISLNIFTMTLKVKFVVIKLFLFTKFENFLVLKRYYYFKFDVT